MKKYQTMATLNLGATGSQKSTLEHDGVKQQFSKSGFTTGIWSKSPKSRS